MFKKRCLALFMAICSVLLLAGCSTAPAPPPPSITPATTVPQITDTPPATQTPVPMPLSQTGPYFVGKRMYTLEDEGQKLEITVWYPAIKPEGYPGSVASKAAPDTSGAPYPLLLSSTTIGNYFSPHLASHGFVATGVNGQRPSDAWGAWLVDYPRETVFMLNQISKTKLEGLEGMIDAEHAGALGYSFDGYNTLALGGARVDPEFYRAQCAQAAQREPPLEEWYIKYYCAAAEDWEAFVAAAGDIATNDTDGLWQPMTDPRIRAVMPMAPEGAMLFGEKGLAEVDRPMLLIGATEDKGFMSCPYDLEAVYIYNHVKAQDRAMISFIGQRHLMIWDQEPKARMRHFATAFFGYHLQGRAEYADYFSPEFVSQYSDLAWGAYTEK